MGCLSACPAPALTHRGAWAAVGLHFGLRQGMPSLFKVARRRAEDLRASLLAFFQSFILQGQDLQTGAVCLEVLPLVGCLASPYNKEHPTKHVWLLDAYCRTRALPPATAALRHLMPAIHWPAAV